MTEPVRHSLFEEIPEDAEVPIFVLDALDPIASLVVEQYANRLQQTGEFDTTQLEMIRQHAKAMAVYRNDLLMADELADDAAREEEEAIIADEELGYSD